jgi:TonB family protein
MNSLLTRHLILLAALFCGYTSAGQTGSSSRDQVLTMADQMPEFPGGEEALFEFLSRNIRYPGQAIQENVQGVVYVGFVVREDGRLTDLDIVRGLYRPLDLEALRVAGSMPDWIPGQHEGEVRPVRYTLPIRFAMKKRDGNNMAVTATTMEPIEDFTPWRLPPMYPGGEEALRTDLNKGVVHPTPGCRKQGIIDVVLSIDAEGRMTDARIRQGINPPCNEVALEAVRTLRRWRPGLASGTPKAMTVVVHVVLRDPD